MALTIDEIKDVARQMGLAMFQQQNATANLNLDDLIAAVNSVDTFLESSKNYFYSSVLPSLFNNNATEEQKALLLVYVAGKRAKVNI